MQVCKGVGWGLEGVGGTLLCACVLQMGWGNVRVWVGGRCSSVPQDET